MQNSKLFQEFKSWKKLSESNKQHQAGFGLRNVELILEKTMRLKIQTNEVAIQTDSATTLLESRKY